MTAIQKKIASMKSRGYQLREIRASYFFAKPGYTVSIGNDSVEYFNTLIVDVFGNPETPVLIEHTAKDSLSDTFDAPDKKLLRLEKKIERTADENRERSIKRAMNADYEKKSERIKSRVIDGFESVYKSSLIEIFIKTFPRDHFKYFVVKFTKDGNGNAKMLLKSRGLTGFVKTSKKEIIENMVRNYG